MFYVNVIGGASAGINIRTATATTTLLLLSSIIHSVRLLVARSLTNSDPHRDETRSYATNTTRTTRIDRMKALFEKKKNALTSQT